METDPVRAPLETLAKMMAAFGAKLVELPADPMARVQMRVAHSDRTKSLTRLRFLKLLHRISIGCYRNLQL